jgi:hypothetical protein
VTKLRVALRSFAKAPSQRSQNVVIKLGEEPKHVFGP